MPNPKSRSGMGVVEENGPEAHKFRPGQRVVAVSWPARSNPKLDRSKAAGTFQQYLAVPEDVLVLLEILATLTGNVIMHLCIAVKRGADTVHVTAVPGSGRGER